MDPTGDTPGQSEAPLPEAQPLRPPAQSAMASLMAYGNDDSSDSEGEGVEIPTQPKPEASVCVGDAQESISVKPDFSIKSEFPLVYDICDQAGQSIGCSEVGSGNGAGSEGQQDSVVQSELVTEAGEVTPSAAVSNGSGENDFISDPSHRPAHNGYDSDSASSDSSSSVSSGLEEIRQTLADEDEAFKGPVKTKGELGLKDLPPIEELSITVKETDKMLLVGEVRHIVNELLVVESKGNIPALNQDSIFFRENRTPLGQVFEVFGPVPQPFYSVRFNSEEEIKAKGISIGDKVYFTPERLDLFEPVNVAEMKKFKGSDASWENNNEPPPNFIDYSDDEEERQAKGKKKGKGHAASSSEGQEERNVRRKRTRQEMDMSRGSDSGSNQGTQDFSGPHWPPQGPPHPGSSVPRFGPPPPHQQHFGPRPGMGHPPQQGPFRPRLPPAGFPRQPLVGAPRFQPPSAGSFPPPPHHQQAAFQGYHQDPNQHARFQGPPQFHGQGVNPFSFQGQQGFAVASQWNGQGGQGPQQQNFFGPPRVSPPRFGRPNY